MVISAERPGGLTPIQREILEAIRGLTRDRRHPPSMREVLENVDLDSPGALAYQYRRLEDKGYMRREAGRPRTVEVRLPGEPDFPPEAGEPGQLPGNTSPEPDQARATPGRGEWTGCRLPGGSRQAARSWPSSRSRTTCRCPRRWWAGKKGLFILEVVGDSMIGAGIFSGDWVVVRPLFEAPQDGDIVAATIDGIELEGTVKTYKKVGRQVWLMPQNLADTPIPGGKAKFAGKVIAVLRRV